MGMNGQAFINRPMSIALDAVRGGAALIVLMGHAVQQRIYTGPWPFTTMLQHNAVVVFFVLSGLVIANSVIQRQTSLGEYATARAARILPVTIVAIAFSLALYCVGQALGLTVINQGVPNDQASPAAVVLPLFFLSESIFGTGPVWNPPFWSLVYEVWYYALFGAGFFLTGWRRPLVIAALAVIAGVKILLLLPIWLTGMALAKYAPARAIPQAAGLVCIVAGLAVVPLSNGLALDGAAWLDQMNGAHGPELRYSGFALTDLMFGVGMALFFLGLRPLADQRADLLERFKQPIQWLANCSFTLYLLHWPILNILHGLNISAGGNVLIFAMILAAIVAFCAAIATVTEHRRKQVRQWLGGLMGRGRIVA